jgi:hypothetical protein
VPESGEPILVGSRGLSTARAEPTDFVLLIFVLSTSSLVLCLFRVVETQVDSAYNAQNAKYEVQSENIDFPGCHKYFAADFYVPTVIHLAHWPAPASSLK